MRDCRKFFEIACYVPQHQYLPRIQALEQLLNSEQGGSVGFNLLREMELIGEDEIDPEGEIEDLEVDNEAEQLSLEVQYEANFPAMKTTVDNKKWGPMQATRMSSRIAGDKITIMEKAQQLKEVQNLEV